MFNRLSFEKIPLQLHKDLLRLCLEKTTNYDHIYSLFSWKVTIREESGKMIAKKTRKRKKCQWFASREPHARKSRERLTWSNVFFPQENVWVNSEDEIVVAFPGKNRNFFLRRAHGESGKRWQKKWRQKKTDVEIALIF